MLTKTTKPLVKMTVDSGKDNRVSKKLNFIKIIPLEFFKTTK